MLVLALLLALCPLPPGGGRSPVPLPSQNASAQTGNIRDLYVRGDKALQEGDLGTAESAFHQVLARQPDDPGANANLGVIYMRRQQWGPALRYLKAGERL